MTLGGNISFVAVGATAGGNIISVAFNATVGGNMSHLEVCTVIITIYYNILCGSY